jgi:hypothetical protein
MGGNSQSRPFHPREKDLILILQEAWWVPGPVWTGAENFAPKGIRCLDRPACSQSLYRLNYLVVPNICYEFVIETTHIVIHKYE